MAQTQKFRGVARAVIDHASGKWFCYHKTTIVKAFKDGRVQLDSGGWKTNTTKNSMNQAANEYALGFRVNQRAREWFVTWKGVELPFVDGMVLA